MRRVREVEVELPQLIWTLLRFPEPPLLSQVDLVVHVKGVRAPPSDALRHGVKIAVRAESVQSARVRARVLEQPAVAAAVLTVNILGSTALIRFLFGNVLDFGRFRN